MNASILEIKIAAVALSTQARNPFLSRSEQFSLLRNCNRAALLTARVDRLIKKHSAFEGITDLVTAKGGYTPTLYTRAANTAQDRTELKLIADYYDSYQQSQGSDKRAYRV